MRDGVEGASNGSFSPSTASGSVQHILSHCKVGVRHFFVVKRVACKVQEIRKRFEDIGDFSIHLAALLQGLYPRLQRCHLIICGL
jgi:hypothetical protein